MIRLAENRAYIEGFLDVTSINDTVIVFVYETYDLKVNGEKLTIHAFNKQEMIIFGKMLTLSFHYRT
ncbi:MAG: hypothetical protein EOM50_08915 [Erysipelotrichia bacterium]|nr:hypothetical protein [Erysipelotrichia bacterium]NCC54564.1 hypothetical protein [Erysipelotrichia bacterium]